VEFRPGSAARSTCSGKEFTNGCASFRRGDNSDRSKNTEPPNPTKKRRSHEECEAIAVLCPEDCG
jgi:hypothetical protein